MEIINNTPATGTTTQDTTARDIAAPSGAYVTIEGSNETVQEALHSLSDYLRDGDVTVFRGPDPAPPAGGSDAPQAILALAVTASSMAEVCRGLSADYPDLHIMRAIPGRADVLRWTGGKVGVASLEQPLYQQGDAPHKSLKLDANEMYVLAVLWETIDRHRGCGPEGGEFADRLACRVARLDARAQVEYFRLLMRHTAVHDCSLMQVPLDDIGAE